MKIRNIYRIIYRKLIGNLNPVKYAKKIGVNMTGRVFLTGGVLWGTEPWIITLGDNVHISDGVRFLTHDGGARLFREKVPDLEITKPITIGNNVFIGNCVILMPGVCIGNNVIIGAGAVVTHNVPDNTVFGGCPAKKIEDIEDYFVKIQDKSIHLGNLVGEEKDIAMREYYKYKGNSKGIYF